MPSWMTVDADAKMVTMDVIAGFNPNNSNWNYNGYHDGDLTVVLPLDWSVHINFTNHDADVPHSMVVTADRSRATCRSRPGRDQAAFSRAYSKSPEQGLSAGDHDLIAFKAKKPGKYLMYLRRARPRPERHVGPPQRSPPDATTPTSRSPKAPTPAVLPFPPYSPAPLNRLPPSRTASLALAGEPERRPSRPGPPASRL